MVGSFSPHGDAGGTLHLPSPTHIHHVDPASAFRQLRRSLSRSPSKTPAFRLVTSKSASPTPSSPLSPSRESESLRSISTGILPPPQTTTPNSLASPAPYIARKARSAPRKLSPMRNSPRPTTIPRSPRKRTLQDSTNSGNVTPQSSAGSSDDQENVIHIPKSPSPVKASPGNGFLRPSAPSLQNSPFSGPRGTARFERGYGSWGAKSSPLKRSDGIMNFDQGNVGSPSAKRRSLHGGIFSPDFDIFDQAAAEGFDTPMADSDANAEESLSVDNLSPMPKRTSSLRRTTLQQRHDKPLFARSKINTDLAYDFATPSQAPHKSRFRMSLDSVLPSMPRESPFSSQAALPNASAHPMSQHGSKHSGTNSGTSCPLQPQRHPLSRTISQSTSNSSVAEDSPTHVPVRHAEHRRPYFDLSKSLPMGAPRPDYGNNDSASQESGASFSTPENYKMAKPLPAAFMSTGLISKRHKNIEDAQPDLGTSTSTMPDTPCKRHSLAEMPSPTAAVQEPLVKSHQLRHSFGTPSTPFNPHASQSSPGAFGKGVSIFGSSLQRKASFLSSEGEDRLQSPNGPGDSQSSADFEIPPTPTKQVQPSTSRSHTPFLDSVSRQAYPNCNVPASLIIACPLGQSQPKCKSISQLKQSRIADDRSDNPVKDHPLASLGFQSFSMTPRSFKNSRLSPKHHKSPAPLTLPFNNISLSILAVRCPEAKYCPQPPASSSFNETQRLSPRTPRSTMLPPDPSGLSISGHNDEQFYPANSLMSSTASAYLPATPTAPRGSFFLDKSKTSVTPSHTPATVEVDPVLRCRFDKVELIGTGEFSQVFRVSKKQELKSNRSYFPISLSTKVSTKASLPDQVFAVKKTRHAYIGARDRQRKLQEVKTLRALGQSDHTVELFNSWEDKGFLYIQTEFCEEGSLDMFLDQVGRKARLDDFRIWKIMLEMSLGIKHVHDSGFIHLDLKPANVLITFEGVLKIADFGMATQWPASTGIEGEGDREYIGPEILRGQFDKPADVFALGLIILEIAGNVMLPDNGASWQRLRTGDMSDVPSLTWSSETSNIARDSSGKPLSDAESLEAFYASDSDEEEFQSPKPLRHRRQEQIKNAPPKPQRSGELAEPPAFMIDQNNPEALDNVVRWMISPQSDDRPVVDQILRTAGVQWAEARRRAGATIFEGNWGPADEVLADDAEMIDV